MTETDIDLGPIVLPPERIVLCVVGAHPRAEVEDRPIAGTVRETLMGRIGRVSGGLEHAVVVLTDVWYLNDPRLNACPTISIGAPPVNALTTYLTDKLPEVYSVRDVLMVQADLEHADLRACLWGQNGEATGAAALAFTERYLDDWADAVVGRWD